MTNRTEIAELWTTGLSAPDEGHVAAVSAVLDPEVVTLTPLGTTEGRPEVLAVFGKSILANAFATGTWSEPTLAGEVVTATCIFTDVDVTTDATVRVTVGEDGLIKRVETTVGDASPPAVTTRAPKGPSDAGPVPVYGTVEPGFESVREAFEAGFQEDELGAAVSAYVDGRKVVDLWGGWANAARDREWERDTVVTTYSATKGATATCAHRLVDRGLLDVDAPVAKYWPEFAQEGKDGITVRMVLTHQAGLIFPTKRVPADKRLDWETMTTALAGSAPNWAPGTRSEYHGGTFGFLVGEIVRRIDGRPLDVFFREEVAEPLGADFMIAFGSEHDHRCAEVVGDIDRVNTREWRAGGDGAATGHGSADGLARLYAALARGGELDGVKLLNPETIRAAVAEQPLANADGTVPNFALGYQLLWTLHPGLPRGTFGHTGMGGSIGLADPHGKLGFGFVMNQIGSNGAARLLTATYRSLAG